jgi:hypothetical protein
VQLQESLCNLASPADQNPFKASPRPEQIEAVALKALSSYRVALQSAAEQEDYLRQVSSFMYLLQMSLMRHGKGKIEASHLESWIDECFPGG